MAAQFNLDLDRFGRNIDAEFAVVMRRTAFGLFTGIIRKTPVDEGRARGNWSIGVNVAPSFPAARFTKSDTPLDEETNKLQLLKQLPYSLVVVANSLNYIRFLEMGSSTQAPGGMVALTINEVEQGIDS